MPPTQIDQMNLIALILVGIAAVIGIVLMLILANFFGVWLRAKIADAPVPFAKLIGMRLRPSSRRPHC